MKMNISVKAQTYGDRYAGHSEGADEYVSFNEGADRYASINERVDAYPCIYQSRRRRRPMT